MDNKDEYVESQTAALAPLGQVLIKLTHENTQALLSSGTEVLRSPESQAQAVTILERLSTLNAEIAPQFHAKQDAFSRLPLRMICNTPTTTETKNAPPSVSTFLIVSYCWHYPAWPIAGAATPIAPGWEVSQPMVDAVMGLRQSADEGVWLDKLCIDQSSAADKMLHIGAMDVLYRSARRMVILLEDVQLTAAEEAAGLAYAGFYKDMSTAVTDMEGAAKSRFIDEYFPSREKKSRDDGTADVLAAGYAFAVKMLGARWYSRAWCAHESRMTLHRKVDNPLLMCFGHKGKVLSFEFRLIFYLAMYLADQEPELDLISNNIQDALSDPNPTTLRQRWWRMLRLMPDRGDNISAMKHLANVLSSGCFMKSDLMSIALNTAGIPLFFHGDAVKVVEDVIWIFSLLVIAAGNIVPLTLSGRRLRIPDGAGKETISWVSGSLVGVIDDKMPTPTPDAITGITKDYVELDLLVFASQPLQASPESLSVASTIIEEHQLDTLARDLLAVADESTQRKVKRAKELTENIAGKFLNVWLAQAIDCGLAWILRFPDVIKSGTATWEDGTVGIDADARLTAAATSLLAHLDTSEEEQDIDGATLQRAIRFMTCAIDQRLYLLSSRPRRLPVNPSAEGPDFAITEPVSDHSYIAVPVAVAHLPGWQDRAWEIEPFDPAAPPEDPAAHLARSPTKEELAVSVEKPSGLLAVDVCPILTSDDVDRREKRHGARVTWRLRKLRPFYGCQDLVKGVGYAEDPAVVLLEKQRVYGADDYDWGAIVAAGTQWEEHPGGMRPRPGGAAGS